MTPCPQSGVKAHDRDSGHRLQTYRPASRSLDVKVGRRPRECPGIEEHRSRVVLRLEHQCIPDLFKVGVQFNNLECIDSGSDELCRCQRASPVPSFNCENLIPCCLSRRQRCDGVVLVTTAEERSQPTEPTGQPSRPATRDRDLGRAPLPPPTRTRRPRRLDLDRVRSHHGTTNRPCGLNQTCHRNLHQTRAQQDV
jgi:hypothetical protein